MKCTPSICLGTINGQMVLILQPNNFRGRMLAKIYRIARQFAKTRPRKIKTYIKELLLIYHKAISIVNIRTMQIKCILFNEKHAVQLETLTDTSK